MSLRIHPIINSGIQVHTWARKLKDETRHSPVFGLLCNDTYYGVDVPGRKMTEEELKARRVDELEWKSDNLWREVDAVLRFEPWMTEEAEDAYDD